MNNNISPVFKAETASDLKNDVFKIGLGLCVYLPLCSFFGAVFLEIFKMVSKPEGNLAEAFLKSGAYPFYSLVISLIPTIATIAIISFAFKRAPSLLMLKPCVLKKDLILYLLMALSILPISSVSSLLSNLILRNVGIEPNAVSAPSGIFATVIFLLVHAIFAPIFEEILFRGLILERLRRYGDLFAIISSAFLFSIMHSSIDSYLPAFLSGLILSLSAVYTGSILVPMIAHFFNNLLSCIMIIITPSLSSSSADFIYIAILSTAAVLSIISAVILQKRGSDAFRLKFNEKILTGGRKTSILLTSFTVLIFIIYSISLAISAI